MSLVGNWQREAARFTPDLRVHVHHGADRLDGESLAEALAGADLVITTYGVATRDQAALGQVSWARVVCDEAQNIKNHATKQARAVRGLPAAARIALTGTPVENRLSELWSIMEFTNPGLLGPAERFRERYAVPIERHGSPEAAQSLKRLTQPFVLRRLKTDKTIISDLPDKQEMKVFCNLTSEQASLYQATVTDMLSRIEEADDDISRRGLVLATMAKLKQVCNHPAHLLGDGSRLAGRSGKLARLEEICDEIVAEGDKALCFTQYAEFGRMLQPHLAARLGCPVLFLHGGTTKKQRDAMVEAFGELDEPALFLLSLKAGGTGLNLTAASHVIHVDRWWNPAVEDQATDRAFRIGQRRNVQVRKFVCVGTLEERIDAMIEEKKALAEQIVGTGEGWLTELSTDELRVRAHPVRRRGERVMSGRWEDWPPAKPIRVDGGIKARSKRGAIGEQWWSRRFISVLESYGMSGRLARGRSYARAGQVLDFALTQGKVTARVQGSRVRPYQVRIGVLPLTTAQWRRVQDRLARQALFRAKLLAGEMPHEIEEVFAECGTPLFPRSAADLDMHCSCPDWGVPCKHLAAVCYVLAEEFDRDPFGMLAWRGKARDELLAALRRIQARSASQAGPGQNAPGQAGPAAGAPRAGLDVPAPPLEDVPGQFLVARAEPGPAAGAGHRAGVRHPRSAAAHVPPAAGRGQAPGPGRRARARVRAARRGQHWRLRRACIAYWSGNIRLSGPGLHADGR